MYKLRDLFVNQWLDFCDGCRCKHMRNPLLPSAVSGFHSDRERAWPSEGFVDWRFDQLIVGAVNVSHGLFGCEGDLSRSYPNNRTVFLVKVVDSVGSLAG
jgi:hypothetical protein